MKMRLVKQPAMKRVLPSEILDYTAFSENHRRPNETSELHLFEKFYASRALVTDGFDTYTDADVTDSDRESSIRGDAVGLKGDTITLVFCETGNTPELNQEYLERIETSENATALILVPKGTQLNVRSFSPPRKITVQALDWFGDQLDPLLQDTLRLVDLIGNETRMRMLTPLFSKTGAKKEYRTKINPKLVYQNITAFLETGLVDEVDEGSYELTQIGKAIMADFIAFLEKTRRTLDSASRHKEVKHIE